MKRICMLVVAVVVASSFVLTVPLIANASCQSTSHYCVWKDIGYGVKLLDDGSGVGSRNIYPSQRDAASSSKNFTPHRWCGVDEHLYTPDTTLYRQNPGVDWIDFTQFSFNDQLDHLDVVGKDNSGNWNACPTD